MKNLQTTLASGEQLAFYAYYYSFQKIRNLVIHSVRRSHWLNS
ncbi:MAG: hypothetical protein V7K38_03840 [Nostoc sp.]